MCVCPYLYSLSLSLSLALIFVSFVACAVWRCADAGKRVFSLVFRCVPLCPMCSLVSHRAMWSPAWTVLKNITAKEVATVAVIESEAGFYTEI